jgi:dTDP-4-amino-4,6-dideoxygalactose transaminase
MGERDERPSEGRSRFLPFSRPTIGEEEIAEVVDCLRSGWITTGPRAERFERDAAAYTGAAHALAFSSGTAALHAAYCALGIGPGDEVICPSLTWPATANMAAALGARVVFADVDRATLQISPESVERLIGPRTKAIVPVHFAGAPADLDRLRELAGRLKGRRISIVEDAAHALGAEYKEKRIGSHGNPTIFSFHPIKAITTGEGGLLATDDADLAARARLFRFHGVSRDAWRAYGEGSSLHYDTLLPGFKYNLTDIAAAIGVHQLKKLDGFIARREAIDRFYRSALMDATGVEIPREPSYPHRHAHHLFPILVERRDEFVARLREEKIGSGLHFEPVHQATFYRQGAYEGAGRHLPATEEVCARILSLPLFPSMTDDDAADVVGAVRKVARAHSRPGGRS